MARRTNKNAAQMERIRKVRNNAIDGLLNNRILDKLLICKENKTEFLLSANSVRSFISG